LLFALQANAQTADDCVDPNFVNPTYQCAATFSPVCACDGKTYFSPCDAINHGGIKNFNYTEGVCGDWEMYLGQMATDRAIRMFFQFKSSGGSLTFMIVDIYGKVMFQQFINTNNSLPIQRDFSTVSFPAGIYIAYAFGGSYRKAIKFSAGGY
jgi:hypothetical protein